MGIPPFPSLPFSLFFADKLFVSIKPVIVFIWVVNFFGHFTHDQLSQTNSHSAIIAFVNLFQVVSSVFFSKWPIYNICLADKLVNVQTGIVDFLEKTTGEAELKALGEPTADATTRLVRERLSAEDSNVMIPATGSKVDQTISAKITSLHELNERWVVNGIGQQTPFFFRLSEVGSLLFGGGGLLFVGPGLQNNANNQEGFNCDAN